ncbi:MAG TPA: phosphoribosyltransferase family protein [Ilumatobacteraceae bacterium]|nr:phosphoribosyltransferase family protein [Ilumatobacteraceae bacterium]
MAHREFKDRLSAGTILGAAVAKLSLVDAVVVGLPRGGVPVAAKVAEAIDAPLDVIVVRKVGVPGQPELAMGAAGEDGILVVNHEVIEITGVSQAELADAARRERDTLDRSVGSIRAVRPRVPLAGRVAVIVDDGIATGATMRAAIRVARANDARSVIVATPVAPREVVAALGKEADRVVCVAQPQPFGSVGRFYRQFDSVADDEVIDLLVAGMARTGE